jgi:hypothetical protein
MPVVDSIDELNAMLAAADEADDRRRIANRANTVGQDWQNEKLSLQPVTGEPFDTALTLTPTGGPVRPAHGARQSVLGAGPVHRSSTAGETIGLARDRL